MRQRKLLLLFPLFKSFGNNNVIQFELLIDNVINIPESEIKACSFCNVVFETHTALCEVCAFDILLEDLLDILHIENKRYMID